MSSMEIAPSSTLSPNIAETRSQQDHWLCELSLVAPALPCPAPLCRGGTGRGGREAEWWRSAEMAHGTDGTARHVAALLGRAGAAMMLPGGANPRQEAGNRAKTDISNAINTCHAFGKMRINNQLAHEA